MPEAAEKHHWEEIDALAGRSGPFEISASMVESYLALVGDAAEIHRDRDYCRALGLEGPVVPGALIHGALDGPDFRSIRLQLLGMRSLYIDFVKPVYPDRPFFIEVDIEEREAMNETLGIATIRRRLLGPDGELLVLSRIRVAVRRRPIT